MAAQNANPPPWDDSMSDGCSGVFDLGFCTPCVRHDHRYHLGGDADDKAFADDELYQDMKDPRFVNWFWRGAATGGMARERWTGVRMLTINYPPGHRLRREENGSVEAFNWLGTANEKEI